MNHNIILSPRLLCIAEKVPHNARLVDVGTDHGYLPLWLLKYDLISQAIASDINKGPLKTAKKNAEAMNESRIQFRLCNGLLGVVPGEVDAVVIAGMGGDTICDILSKAEWTKENITLILQPMTKADVLRKWLISNGYIIKDDDFVMESQRVYTVISALGGVSCDYSAAELYCGCFENIKDKTYSVDYISYEIRKLNHADSLINADSDFCKFRKKEISEMIKSLEQLKDKIVNEGK